MPRAHVESNEPYYERAIFALKSDVVRKVGFEVRTVKECKILSVEIERHDRRFPLAVSTLRRFFQLIPSDSKFSISTLNTLARFAGKRAFSYYLDLTKAESLRNNNRIGTETFQAQEGILPDELPQLVDLLEMAPYAAPGADFLQELAKSAAKAYADSHIMNERLMERLAASKRLRAVIIERYPPLDWLANGQNGSKLLQQYLEYAEHQNERDYAIGLLAQGALFDGDLEQSIKWLNKYAGIDANPSEPPVHQSRACAVLWLVSLWNGDLAMKSKCFKDLVNHIPPRDSIHFPAFAASVARIVIISGNKELIKITRDAIGEATQRAEIALEASHAMHALNLELAWLAFLAGDASLAQNVLAKLTTKSFAAHDQVTSRIFWHALHGHLTPNPQTRSEQFAASEQWARQANYLGLHSQLLLAAPVSVPRSEHITTT